MILEGNERGNGAELAQHLMNARDNEHVTLHAINGFVADDLFGAFAEAEAISAATQCRKYLFSLSLNPPLDAKVSVEDFEAAIAKIEQSLSLMSQPHAIVFHEKLGRRHAHCVWSRIDSRHMKAINIAHYKRKLMSISRELYITHGWDMPAGFEDFHQRDPLNFSRQEAGQAKRIKSDPKKLKAMFLQCWQQSDSRAAFAAALWSEGYCIARGDRRGFVAVDANGEVYSLSRWCGVKTKDLRARLGHPAELPTIDEALDLFEKPVADQPQTRAKAPQFEIQIADLISKQRQERDVLLKAQQDRRVSEARKRQARVPLGMRLIWSRISGAHGRLLQELVTETEVCDARDRDERQCLINRHLKDRRSLENQLRQPDLGIELENAFSEALIPDPRQRLQLPNEEIPFSPTQLRRNPALILGYISEKQARFTEVDIKRTLAKFIDNPLILRNAVNIALASDELVPLTTIGSIDFTTRDYQDAESALLQASSEMAGRLCLGVNPSTLQRAISKQNNRMNHQFGGQLSSEQERALRHVCSDRQLVCIVGLAGAGKSTMLETANAAWRKQGIKVHGAALAGKAADGLLLASGIESRTLASLELSWKNGFEPIGKGEVLVIDEAGMVGTRQLNRITAKLKHIGAKLVLIGDPDQLQPIEAGQPFRQLIDRVSAARLTEIHRQQEEWQKLASRDLAAGRIQDAMNAYEHHGSVHRAKDQKSAPAALVENYMTDHEAYGAEKSCLAFAHRRKDVFALNQAIRGALRHAGDVGGEEYLFETETGPRAFAAGDRIAFTANDKALGVKNGMLETVERIEGTSISVRLDGGDQTRVTFNAGSYRNFDHGYAVTIHKSQGVTVDRAYVLASRTLDTSLTYVAMTRHRDHLDVFLNKKDEPQWTQNRAFPRELASPRQRRMSLN